MTDPLDLTQLKILYQDIVRVRDALDLIDLPAIAAQVDLAAHRLLQIIESTPSQLG